MSQRVIDLQKHISPPTPWGTQGESGATVLSLDISEFLAAYPDGAAITTFTRQDGKTYIHKNLISNETLLIILNQTDTFLVGKCEVQVNWVVEGNRIVKSENFKSFILPSSAELPLPLTTESVAALDDLKGYVEEAKEIVENAQNISSVIFVDSLPATGKPNTLYLLSTNNGLYSYDADKTAWSHLNEKSETSHYDFILGGGAAMEEENILGGGDADDFI